MDNDMAISHQPSSAQLEAMSPFSNQIRAHPETIALQISPWHIYIELLVCCRRNEGWQEHVKSAGSHHRVDRFLI